MSKLSTFETMLSPANPDWAEKRAAARKQLTSRGWFRTSDGRQFDCKTYDASPLGVGIEHDMVVAAGTHGMLALAVLDVTGTPAVFQAVAEVRHSVLSNGRWRTGLKFVTVSDEHKKLFERVLKPRLSVYEDTAAVA